MIARVATVDTPTPQRPTLESVAAEQRRLKWSGLRVVDA